MLFNLRSFYFTKSLIFAAFIVFISFFSVLALAGDVSGGQSAGSGTSTGDASMPYMTGDTTTSGNPTPTTTTGDTPTTGNPTPTTTTGDTSTTTGNTTPTTTTDNSNNVSNSLTGTGADTTTGSGSSSSFDLSSIFDFFSDIVDWLFNVISKFGTYLLNLVLFIPRYFYAVLADLVVYFLDFAYSFLPNFSGIAGLISSINSSSIGFFLDLFQFTFGLKVVLGAYFCRFFIRRLPVIG